MVSFITPYPDRFREGFEPIVRAKFATVDEYIGSFPVDTRRLLEAIRQVIRRAAPDAEETISYGMPAFRENGILVYFAAFADHIGFFPTASGIEAFKDDLAAYKTSKGTVQFPYGKPIPYDLVEKIVAFRVRENRKKISSSGPG